MASLEMADLGALRGFNVPDRTRCRVPPCPTPSCWASRIYTDYPVPVQIAAVLLLVAIIAAIALTLRRRKGVYGQNPAEQVKAKEGRPPALS